MGTGQNGTHMVLVSRDANTIFTANIGSDSISVIDRTAGPLGWNETVIPVGKGPEGIDLSPDGKEIWTAHSRDGGVSIIDVATRKVIQTIYVQTKRSNRLKFTPNGKRVLISDLEGGDLVVLDFGAMHDLYDSSPHRMQLFELSPGLVFRSIGLGAVCQALGGLLAGVPVDAARANRRYPGANQGALLIALDPGCLMPREAFVREMEEYVARARRLAPMPGYDTAHLPGGPEWERERQWAESGPPLTIEHLERLEELGRELGLPDNLRGAG